MSPQTPSRLPTDSPRRLRLMGAGVTAWAAMVACGPRERPAPPTVDVDTSPPRASARAAPTTTASATPDPVPALCRMPPSCPSASSWTTRCGDALEALPPERHMHLEACLPARCDFDHCLAYAYTTQAIGYLMGAADTATFDLVPHGSLMVTAPTVTVGSAPRASAAVAGLRGPLRRCHRALGAPAESLTFVFTLEVDATGATIPVWPPEKDALRAKLRSCAEPHLKKLDLGVPAGSTAEVRFVAAFAPP